MPRQNKPANTGKQKRQAVENRDEQTGVARPRVEALAWAAANQLHAGGKKIASRRNLPSGPLGGSGRKTNLARSS